jgi:hypothetical protein
MKTAFILAACLTLFAQTSRGAGGILHNRMVRQTGIQPVKIGAYEGVGRSSSSHAAAIASACYAGQKQPIHIQLSETRNRRGQIVMYNAVVQYK